MPRRERKASPWAISMKGWEARVVPLPGANQVDTVKTALREGRDLERPVWVLSARLALPVQRANRVWTALLLKAAVVVEEPKARRLVVERVVEVAEQGAVVEKAGWVERRVVQALRS